MSKHRRGWDEEEYREHKQPKRIEKDKLTKHKKAIYDMVDEEDDSDYFTDDYSYDEFEGE